MIDRRTSPARGVHERKDTTAMRFSNSELTMPCLRGKNEMMRLIVLTMSVVNRGQDEVPVSAALSACHGHMVAHPPIMIDVGTRRSVAHAA